MSDGYYRFICIIMEEERLSFTYKFLRLLGFNYPVEDYGQVSLWKVIKQFFVSQYHRLLMNMMNWVLLEPIAPRKLRPIFAKMLGCKVGKGVFIGEYVRFDLNHSDLITIEDGVHIAGDVRLLCHKKDLSNYYQGAIYGHQPYKYGEIFLRRNCALGSGTIVMPGVTIGEGAVVGAGSLVTKDIPAWTIALGRPAKVVKEIPKQNEIK